VQITCVKPLSVKKTKPLSVKAVKCKSIITDNGVFFVWPLPVKNWPLTVYNSLGAN